MKLICNQDWAVQCFDPWPGSRSQGWAALLEYLPAIGMTLVLLDDSQTLMLTDGWAWGSGTLAK